MHDSAGAAWVPLGARGAEVPVRAMAALPEAELTAPQPVTRPSAVLAGIVKVTVQLAPGARAPPQPLAVKPAVAATVMPLSAVEPMFVAVKVFATSEPATVPKSTRALETWSIPGSAETEVHFGFREPSKPTRAWFAGHSEARFARPVTWEIPSGPASAAGATVPALSFAPSRFAAS